MSNASRDRSLAGRLLAAVLSIPFVSRAFGRARSGPPYRSACLSASRWALLLVVVLGAGLALAAEDALKIGVYGQDPPRSFVNDDGELIGFDIDIARALCAQLRLDCRLIPMDWSALIPALEAREVDAVVASVSVTDTRRQRVAFTRPYYVSPARFVSRRGEFADVDPATLKGKRIGVRRGTTFDDYVTDNYAPYAEILRYPTQLGALLDLVLERIDLVIGDQLVLHQTFLATPQGQDYEFVGPLLSDPVWFGAGNAVAVAKNDRGLRTLLDRAVADIHVNGVFERIQRTWFSRDIRGPEK